MHTLHDGSHTKTSKIQACPPNQLGAIGTVWIIDSLPTMGQVVFHG